MGIFQQSICFLERALARATLVTSQRMGLLLFLATAAYQLALVLD